VFEVIGASRPPTSTSAILTRGVATTLHGATSGRPSSRACPVPEQIKGLPIGLYSNQLPYFGSRGSPVRIWAPRPSGAPPSRSCSS